MNLPGHATKADEGAICENHPDRAAVYCVRGETDSFGAEYIDMCKECYETTMKHLRGGFAGMCDWCKKEAPLTHMRDFDEGSSGPVYQVCMACKTKRNLERDKAELRFFNEL